MLDLAEILLLNGGLVIELDVGLAHELEADGCGQDQVALEQDSKEDHLVAAHSAEALLRGHIELYAHQHLLLKSKLEAVFLGGVKLLHLFEVNFAKLVDVEIFGGVLTLDDEDLLEGLGAPPAFG